MRTNSTSSVFANTMFNTRFIPAVVQFYFVSSDEDVFVRKDCCRLVEKVLEEPKGVDVGGVHGTVNVGRVAVFVLAIGQQPWHPQLPRLGVACMCYT